MLRTIFVWLFLMGFTFMLPAGSIKAQDSLELVLSELRKSNQVYSPDFIRKSLDLADKKLLAEPDSAFMLASEILRQIENTEDLASISKANHIIGHYYTIQGIYSEALSFLSKSLSLQEKLPQTIQTAEILSDIGYIHFLDKEYEKSTDFYNQALIIYNNFKYKDGIVNSYLYLGKISFELKVLNNALEFLKRAERMFVYNEKMQMGVQGKIFFEIGNVYWAAQNDDLALKYYTLSVSSCEKNDEQETLVNALHAIAGIYLEKNEPDRARNLVQNAASILLRNSSKKLLAENFRMLAKIDSISGDYQSAYYNLLQYKLYNDSAYNQETKKQVSLLREKYESVKKDKKLADQQNEINIQTTQRRFLIIILIAILILVVFLTVRLVINRKRNHLLNEKNHKIEEQNHLLVQQKMAIQSINTELEEQQEEIIRQKQQIEEAFSHIEIQKNELEESHRDIRSSLSYARRIQLAILPPPEYMRNLLPEHFVLYKPRDVVSGDFYWLKQYDNKIFLASADCTGHGVPGAFMSMMGVAFLNDIVSRYVRQKDTIEVKSSQMLEELRFKVKSALRQTGRVQELQDGMDMALCIIDTQLKTVQYAGAYSPLFIVRPFSEFAIFENDAESLDRVKSYPIKSVDPHTKEEVEGLLVHLKADRNPIGIYMREIPFTNLTFSFSEHDILYLFSDGFIDQAGGNKGRKFMGPNFRELISQIHIEPMNKQVAIFEDTFESWIGYPSAENRLKRQLDDVMILGVKLNFSHLVHKPHLKVSWKDKLVLVAEDDTASFFVVNETLTNLGAKVLWTQNGEEAVKIVQANPNISLILMDVQMPIMNGYEATAIIKKSNPDIPIIILTAFSLDGEKEKGFVAGCSDFINKPPEEDLFIHTVSRYLS